MRLIDADAMLVRLEEWNTSDSTDKALYNFTLHRILEQPTIEPERKNGKWIVEGKHPKYHLRCSECRKIAMWANGISYIYPNFCPNCGAKME